MMDDSEQQLGSAGPAAADGAPVLSKNQQKKLAKLARYAEKKRERREKEKAHKQELQQQRKAEVVARMETMNAEEKAQWREAKAQRIRDRKLEAEEKRKRLQTALEQGQRILIDCSFEDMMTDTELRSLCQQLAYSYHANSRASPPVHLILTGIAGRMRDVLRRQCSGLENWIVTCEEGDYLQAFAAEKDNLVYLTADSNDEIQELDPAKIYIVGGIVDRNRHKRLCADKAESQGIATARLPIGEYVALSSSSVMCTNHVVEIMIRQQELHDWQAAFEAVIPTRKRKAEDEPAEEGSGVAAAKETEPAAAAKETEPAAAAKETEPAAAAEETEPAAAAKETEPAAAAKETEPAAAAEETEPAAAAEETEPAADKPVSEDGPEPAGHSAEPVLPAPESSAPVGSQELESTA